MTTDVLIPRTHNSARSGTGDAMLDLRAGRRHAFELTRLALGYRLLQLLALPLESMARAPLQAALAEIGRS